MRGRCMRFEVVLHAYRHFRWDGMTMLSEGLVSPLPRTRRRYLYSKRHPSLHAQPAHRPLTTPSPELSRLAFIDVSYNYPLVLAPLPPRLSHLRISVHLRDSELCRQCHQRLTTSSHCLLRGSIPAKQLSSRSSLRFSTIVPLMTASAPSPRPSCNHSRTQWNGPYNFPHHLHRKSCPTKPMKANPIMVQQRVLQNSQPPLSPPHHIKTPHAPNQCPSHVTQSTTPNCCLSCSTSSLSPAFPPAVK